MLNLGIRTPFLLPLAPLGSSWLLLAPPGTSCLLLAPPGSSWLFLAPPGLARLLLAQPGSAWLISIPPGPLAPLGSSWLLLAPLGSSWRPPGSIACTQCEKKMRACLLVGDLLCQVLSGWGPQLNGAPRNPGEHLSVSVTTETYVASFLSFPTPLRMQTMPHRSIMK